MGDVCFDLSKAAGTAGVAGQVNLGKKPEFKASGFNLSWPDGKKDFISQEDLATAAGTFKLSMAMESGATIEFVENPICFRE